MAKNKDKIAQGSPVQGDFAAFSGFEEKCGGGKGGKNKGNK
ncbi:MAG: hypothetical protein RIN56_16715 [Sporomusaceae bacterium]|nr:hypothetical protein [Sporomusaceae bacterium]